MKKKIYQQLYIQIKRKSVYKYFWYNRNEIWYVNHYKIVYDGEKEQFRHNH